MIPVTQNKVVVKKTTGETVIRGNCYAAVIASFLDLPITEVPNFEIWYQFEGSFYDDLRDRFLNLKGYKWEDEDAYLFRVFHDDMLDDLSHMDAEKIAECKELLKDRYYFCAGYSPRGIYHITIWKNGKLIHDPHPTKEGLKSIDAMYQILPLNEDEKMRVEFNINQKLVKFPNISL